MPRLTATDFDPEVLKLFDGYVHGRLSRRDFLARAGRYAVGGATAATLLAQLSPSFAAPMVAASDARLKTIIQQVNAELTAERTTLDNEAKALDAKKATLAQDALEQQASALQIKANAWQRKGQLRQKEVEATEQKALSRVYQELDTPIRQVYQAQKCSILLDRESVMLANPAMDITDAVVAALDARIKTLTFDRERLDQQLPGAQALQPTNK